MGRDGRTRISSGLLRLALVLIPLGIFCNFVHWQIILPKNVGWLLQGDWGAHVIGWNALRNDAWRWPLGGTQLLAWPYGVTVTYTDSNPLICLLLKPFSGVLPRPFQFTGLWLLSCVVLQFWTAYLLLRPDGRGRVITLVGATLLTIVPTLFNRLGHADLCAHWTILLALHAFINVRPEARRDPIYGAVLVLSALIHPYLLLMNAGIWASDVLRRAVPPLRTRAWGEVITLAWRSAAVALAPILVLWATGALGGYTPEGGGFGYYSMALDALINPGVAAYSRLLPAPPQGEGQVFEGFQYLGAGLLGLMVACAVLLATSSAVRAQFRRMGWLGWLGPAMFVLLALALSDHIQFHGRVVARLSYDWLPFHLTSTFRSSGRLFWPCAYVLILVALKLVLALPRPQALAFGLLAVALQLLDLTGLQASTRGLTARALSPEVYVSMTSRKWAPLISSADLVEFEPPDSHADPQGFYDIAWRASSLGRPINVMYTARVKPQQAAYEAAAHARFMAGELNPRHLYVLTKGCIPPRIDATRVKMVNGVLVIPPAGVAYPFVMKTPLPVPTFPLGQTVDLQSDAPSLKCLLANDWSVREGWGAWSDGEAPELFLPLGGPPAGDLLLTIRALPFPAEGQDVFVLVGGRAIGLFRLTGGPTLYAVRIPRALIEGSRLDVVLKVAHPQSPNALKQSSDTRMLGIGLQTVRLDPAPP